MENGKKPGSGWLGFILGLAGIVTAVTILCLAFGKC